MERCFRAEADKLAGVRMDRSWLYKEPPISSTCLNIMHTICFYHSVTQSSPTSEKIQAFKKIAVPPVCNPQGSFAPPPPPEGSTPFQTNKMKFSLCTHLYGFLSQNLYFIVSMQEEVDSGRGPKPKAREAGSQRAAGDTMDGTSKDGGRDLMKLPLQILS